MGCYRKRNNKTSRRVFLNKPEVIYSGELFEIVKFDSKDAKIIVLDNEWVPIGHDKGSFICWRYKDK